MRIDSDSTAQRTLTAVQLLLFFVTSSRVFRTCGSFLWFSLSPSLYLFLSSIAHTSWAHSAANCDHWILWTKMRYIRIIIKIIAVRLRCFHTQQNTHMVFYILIFRNSLAGWLMVVEHRTPLEITHAQLSAARISIFFCFVATRYDLVSVFFLSLFRLAFWHTRTTCTHQMSVGNK